MNNDTNSKTVCVRLFRKLIENTAGRFNALYCTLLYPLCLILMLLFFSGLLCMIAGRYDTKIPMETELLTGAEEERIVRPWWIFSVVSLDTGYLLWEMGYVCIFDARLRRTNSGGPRARQLHSYANASK